MHQAGSREFSITAPGTDGEKRAVPVSVYPPCFRLYFAGKAVHRDQIELPVIAEVFPPRWWGAYGRFPPVEDPVLPWREQVSLLAGSIHSFALVWDQAIRSFPDFEA